MTRRMRGRRAELGSSMCQGLRRSMASARLTGVPAALYKKCKAIANENPHRRRLDTPQPIRYRAPMAALGGPSLSWSNVADLIRLRNQTGSLLLLFPTLWALVLAGDGHPQLPLTAIFVAGGVFLRSAGGTSNDPWDRDLDRRGPRTPPGPPPSPPPRHRGGRGGASLARCGGRSP